MNYIYFVLILFLVSCKSIIKNAYQVNKEIQFESREDYKNIAETKYKIKPANLFYTSRSDYLRLIELINLRKVDYFYGIFTDETTKLRASNYLNDNQSCRGRIMKEMQSKSGNIIRDSLFQKISFYNIINANRSIFPNGKHRIVLIFGHTQGLLKRKDFKEIQDIVLKNPKFELFIISLDPIYYYEENVNQTH